MSQHCPATREIAKHLSPSSNGSAMMSQVFPYMAPSTGHARNFSCIVHTHNSGQPLPTQLLSTAPAKMRWCRQRWRQLPRRCLRVHS